MPLRARPHAVVIGTGSAAEAAVRALGAGGYRVQRMADLEQAAAGIATVALCVVAGAGPDTGALLTRIERLSERRAGRRPPLRLVLIRDATDLEPPAMAADARLRLVVLDPAREAVRVLFERWPLHGAMDPGFGQRVHLLIAGDAPPAAALALQAMRLAHYGGEGPVLTLAVDDPGARRAALLAAHPQAERLCRLRFLPIAAPDLGGEPPVTAVFVCVEPPEQGLATARRLAELTGRTGAGCAPIHLETGGVPSRGGIGDWDGRILPFSYLDDGLRAALLPNPGGTGDGLARVIHEHYRDSIAAQGRDPAAEPAGRLWEDLDASYRDASREQAAHLWAKLAVVDCRAVAEERVEVFTFTPLEVERLAEIEHRRWAADRWLAGWSYAPVRDSARRHHPQLIPYAELSGPMKDLDRYAVRLVPTLLARSGLGLQRLLLAGVAPAGDVRVERSLRRRVDEALGRLIRRHPDRSLVLAATLEDAASRLVVRRGVTAFDAGFFLLCPRPLADILAAQPDDTARRDLLELAAVAERRVPLAGEPELARWLAARARVTVLCGPRPKPESVGRWVRIGPKAVHWGFEYAD